MAESGENTVHPLLKVVDRVRGAVCQAAFCLGPDVLVGVELGRVGRKAMDMQPPIAQQVIGNDRLTVHGTAVPQKHDPAAQMAEQVAEELDDLLALDVFAMATEIQTDPTPHPRDGDR